MPYLRKSLAIHLHLSPILGMRKFAGHAALMSKHDKSKQMTLSGKAILCAALLIPFLGAAAGLAVRYLDEPRQTMSGVAAPASHHKARKRILSRSEVNRDREAVTSEIKKYDQTVAELRACQKRRQGRQRYADLLSMYEHKNKKTHDRLMLLLTSDANTRMNNLENFRDKMGGKGSSRRAVQVAQGAAYVYVADDALDAQFNSIALRLSQAEGGPDVDATSDLCRQLAAEISSGGRDVSPNVLRR